jgi:hypothetical protein
VAAQEESMGARGGGEGTGGEGDGPNAAGGPGFELIAEGEVFAGDRETVRRASVKRSLELVLQFSRRG